MQSHRVPTFAVPSPANQVFEVSTVSPENKAPSRHAKPFSPETLGERWGCSAEKIRQMFHSGELAGFRLGKLIRIPANEVERYECAVTQTAAAMAAPDNDDDLISDPVPTLTAAERRLARMSPLSAA